MKEKKCTSFLLIKNYIHKLILPKCNIVFGALFSSIYFQIFINICHDETVELWKYNKCWLSQETIAKNLHCSKPTVIKQIEYMENLDLIKVSKHLRHNVYTLQNNQINDENELLFFLNKFNNNLLSYAQSLGKNSNSIKQKFIELDLELAYHHKSAFKFIRETKLENTNRLRNTINKIEKENNGITLFYINDILFPNKHLQVYRAMRCGIGRTTLNKYLQYSIKTKLINSINIGGEKMDKIEKYVCPICKSEFTSKRSLILHISKNKEVNHKLLSEMHKLDKDKDLNSLFEVNKDKFTKMEIPYNNIQCKDCNGNCKLCYKEVKEDFDKCTQERKQYFEKQEMKWMQKIDKQINKKPKKANPNSSPNLLKYFYDKTKTQSPGFARECKQIKNLLDKNYTPEQIKITMDYLIRRKNVDLRFLNRNIEEAILEDKYKKDINVVNSASYLVQLFHNKSNVKLNSFNFISEVNKIQSVLDEKYTPLEIKRTMKYMLNRGCKTINFLPNMIDEALMFYKSENKDGNNELDLLENNLKYNIMKLDDIKDKYKDIINIKAKEIFKDKSYYGRYTKFEWAYMIHLNLDKELINDGLLDKQKNKWYFDINCVDYDEKDFMNWLKNQFKFNNIEYSL